MTKPDIDPPQFGVELASERATAPHAEPEANADSSVAVVSPPSVSGSLVGPGVQLLGVLLWSYVVVGQYVVRAGFPEALGATVVLAVYAACWYRLVTHRRLGPALWTIGPGLVGAGATVVVVGLVATLLPSGTREAELVTIALWVFSSFAYLVGRVLGDTPQRSPSKRQRALRIVQWGAIGVATVIALIASVERL